MSAGAEVSVPSQSVPARGLTHALCGATLNPLQRLLVAPMSLEDAPHGYALFKHKQDGCVRVVFTPDNPAHDHVTPA
jgi:hypothetical protein